MKSKLLRLYNTIKTKIKNKKIISIISLAIISLILMMGIGYFHYGIGMSDQTKNDNIKAQLSQKKYDKAKKLTNRYFKGTDTKATTMKEYNINMISICEESGVGTLDEAINKLQEYLNSVKIIKTEVKSRGYYNSYKDIEVTVQNNSKNNINYVKIGLYFLDKDGNIIQSDWTNDSSIIKPGATQKITKMVSNDIKFTLVKAEILDFR